MVNAQKWLDKKYPNKEEVKEIKGRKITGELIITDFPQLEKISVSAKLTQLHLKNCPQLTKLYCGYNKLTQLTITNCPNLRGIDAGNNQLTNLDLSNNQRLEKLNISSNNFSSDLSFLSHLVNLKELYLNDNNFAGSLEPLQNLGKLKKLDIDNTNLSQGLEYLPESVKEFSCKKTKLVKELGYFAGDWKNYRGWKKNGFSEEEVREWVMIETIDFIGLKVNEHENEHELELGFDINDINGVNIDYGVGLTINEYEFADYLKNKKNLAPQEAKNNLTELRKEYEWRDICADFSLELRRKWERVGFDKKQTKEWIKVDLTPEDANYCAWLKNIKGKDAEWVSNYKKNEQELRKKYNKISKLGEELIPHEEFVDISDKTIGEGGFGKVYKAKWNGKMVALKVLNNSADVKEKLLQEIYYHKLFESDWGNSQIVKCHGISQDPDSKNYIMVMDYIKDGDLREYLKVNSFWLSFDERFSQLHTIAKGLSFIHSQGLTHRDLHSGNILNNSASECYITDLGLCRPVNETNKEDKAYGVLPYVAPEVLLERKYTQKADIYSFGIIAYEIFFGLPPYYDLVHNQDLALKICLGLRPNIDKLKIPQLLKDLIKKCWDIKLDKRPKASQIDEFLWSWKDEMNNSEEENTEFYQQYEEAKEKFDQTLYSTINNQTYQTHPQAIYTSRLLDFKNLPKQKNSKEIDEQFWVSRDISLNIENVGYQLEDQTETSLQAQIQIPPK